MLGLGTSNASGLTLGLSERSVRLDTDVARNGAEPGKGPSGATSWGWSPGFADRHRHPAWPWPSGLVWPILTVPVWWLGRFDSPGRPGVRMKGDSVVGRMCRDD